ncbi:class I SAM-dependent methyltransferase [Williamsia maris]|uniref:Methyltransferase domain-containing protein n=1 Tax=Williamsia maris TaxID=72806 RepID=A0ABT1HBV2_9NOCA|nr:methyltransferase domain-containing protein [Williamsia maris]MCP2175747.1 Methyltransferase domain-containing protein [Williamsia maris]
MSRPHDADASRLAARSLARGDVTGWFEDLYLEAAGGHAVVPWDAPEANPMIVDALADAGAAAGRSALVVGSGLGRDAEHIASLGYRTTAFDVSPTGVDGARARFPESAVDYVVADLLDLPSRWHNAFDLVVESITVQSMPPSVRDDAIAAVAATVAPGGRLLVISGVRADGVEIDGPPWPLTRAEVDSFAAGGLTTTSIEQIERADIPGARRWRAWFGRA